MSVIKLLFDCKRTSFAKKNLSFQGHIPEKKHDFFFNRCSLEANLILICLTVWRRNYYFFFNFSTSCTQNVNNTGTKQVTL